MNERYARIGWFPLSLSLNTAWFLIIIAHLYQSIHNPVLSFSFQKTYHCQSSIGDKKNDTSTTYGMYVCMSVPGDLWVWSVEILVFPSFMLTSFAFFLFNDSRYILWISLKCSVNFLKSWTWTTYVSNSTSTSPFIAHGIVCMHVRDDPKLSGESGEVFISKWSGWRFDSHYETFSLFDIIKN
jgi:hypothetical protein